MSSHPEEAKLQRERLPASASRVSGATNRNSPYSRPSRSSAAEEGASWNHDRYNPNSRSGHYSRDAPKSPTYLLKERNEQNQVKPTGKLIIENLHYEVSEKELHDLFEQIGPVAKSYIKFDRSGRSTGVAVVIYHDSNHALEAKNEYDGAKAKGQVISITQEMRADRSQRGDSNNQSLLFRFDLSSRLKDGQGSVASAPSNSFADRLGPVRKTGREAGSSDDRQTARKPAPASGQRQRQKRKPTTAAELDAELEAFMNGSTSAPQPAAEAADVEMT